MEYLKNICFWKKDYNINKEITEGLTKRQIKKYRKQYLKVARNLAIFSIVYILGIISLLEILFLNNQIWTIPLIALILRDYGTVTKELSHESTLIQERIQKRKQKNKKQNIEVTEEK